MTVNSKEETSKDLLFYCLDFVQEFGLWMEICPAYTLLRDLLMSSSKTAK
jgi:hypothetical protein